MSRSGHDEISPQRPLEGLRVLELSQIMAGPTCGLMLADMGADVVKNERFPEGDIVRGYRKNGDAKMPPSFAILNRGKRSIAVDITRPQGKEIVMRLAAEADVVTENFRPGTLERLGLGYEDLQQNDPALIYCSISGYGPRGPLAHKGGFDLILQAYAGLISATGEPGGKGVKPCISVADVNAGLLAATGIVSAYVRRLRTGKGCRVETSLLQAAMQQTYWFAASYFSAGVIPGRLGTAHPLIAPYQTYACSDEEIAIGGGNQANWIRVAEVLGHPEWVADLRFVDGQSRLQNRQVLAELMESVLRTRSVSHWLECLDARGVPAGPVQNVSQALDHVQTRAVDMVIDVVDSEGASGRAIGHPIHFDGRNDPVRSPAPGLGAHTREVLSEAGFSAEQLDELHALGVIWSDRSHALAQ